MSRLFYHNWTTLGNKSQECTFKKKNTLINSPEKKNVILGKALVIKRHTHYLCVNKLNIFIYAYTHRHMQRLAVLSK